MAYHWQPREPASTSWPQEEQGPQGAQAAWRQPACLAAVDQANGDPGAGRSPLAWPPAVGGGGGLPSTGLLPDKVPNPTEEAIRQMHWPTNVTKLEPSVKNSLLFDAIEKMRVKEDEARPEGMLKKTDMTFDGTASTHNMWSETLVTMSKDLSPVLRYECGINPTSETGGCKASVRHLFERFAALVNAEDRTSRGHKYRPQMNASIMTVWHFAVMALMLGQESLQRWQLSYEPQEGVDPTYDLKITVRPNRDGRRQARHAGRPKVVSPFCR